jgi:hypothetical protein
MDNPHNRALWAAIICTVAAFVALVASGLAWLGGERPAIAILTGGVILLLTLACFLGSGPQYRPEEE